MAENSLSPEAMAARINGASVSAVLKWMRDERLPRAEQMRRIFEVTEGKVAPNDFVLPVVDEEAAA